MQEGYSKKTVTVHIETYKKFMEKCRSKKVFAYGVIEKAMREFNASD